MSNSFSGFTIEPLKERGVSFQEKCQKRVRTPLRFHQCHLDKHTRIVYYVVHMTFGKYIRNARENRLSEDRTFSVRQVAQRIGVEPSYLSKIERDQVAPPSEATVRLLAGELGEDADLLLAMAGKVSGDLRNIIMQRPQLFAELLRQLKDAPDHAIESVAREIRDGDW